MYCGIDVGLKRCHAAVISDRLEFSGLFEELRLDNIMAAGIDAPLSFPSRGSFRECEKLLLKMGIRLFPSGAPFFRKIAIRGMEIAEELRNIGIRVYEVYPYATRVILNIAPRAKKRKKEGLMEILGSLSRWVEIDAVSHDEADAIIAALTVKMYEEGKGVMLKGSDGEIIVPMDPTQLRLSSDGKINNRREYGNV
ncbi:DUF429 domain-containing protein [Archaeoglobus neptunius]|uniref:DUF429 domain-containing protein n=1 Tax=Archaeoglobus neptunius TaxID=2798580 RepID=UPI0019287231